MGHLREALVRFFGTKVHASSSPSGYRGERRLLQAVRRLVEWDAASTEKTPPEKDGFVRKL